MISIINLGMNHETAPIEVRECFATGEDPTGRALDRMREMNCIKEGLFLITCNRVEVILTTETPGEAKESITSFFSALGNMPKGGLLPALYTFEGADAIRHVFSVASSLDSMVMGEPQILGQIKTAYAKAAKEKMTGVILNRLMHRAFHVAKRVRTETGICDSAVSISYAAVELARKIFHDLEEKRVLLVGAGEMAELAARHLMTQGVRSMAVANRTFSRAVEVAQAFRAQPVGFEEMDRELLEADIVITSTGSPGFVFTYDQVRNSLKKRRSRSLFFIDIAVPRDVEPEVNSLDSVYVYDIDDLKGVTELNMAQRRQEAVKAQRIVEEEVIKFEKWLKTLEVVPTIVSLKDKADALVQAELKKSSVALNPLTPSQRDAVEILIRSIAEKMLNDPILFLKGRADRPVIHTYLDLTRKLFNLDREVNESRENITGGGKPDELDGND